MRAKLISNPSATILGKPGLGKSTVARRMVLGLAGYGVQPLILGDLKPDYRDLIVALNGQVIDLAPGRGNLNVLDPGEAMAASARLTGSKKTWLISDARQRRANTVSGLITILRAGTPPTDREESVIGRAMEILDDRHHGVPVIADLLQVVKDAPHDLRDAALDRGSLDKYRDLTEGLEATLQSLSAGTSRLGTIFSRPTSEPMRRDSPVAFDLSGIDEGQQDLQAAALLACWSNGFATVNVAQVLADAGLEP
ncbi:MAG: helicase HerA domain-containing protein, partial [Nocardioidaceae bacterium]